MGFEAAAKVQIPFHDVDILEIVWHGHYFKYFEIARTALMQELGLDWPQMKEFGYALPIIHAEAKYRQGLKYNSEVLVKARIAEPFLAAVEVNYQIMSLDQKVLFAEGETRQAYLHIATRTTSLGQPDVIRTHLESLARAEGEG